MRDLKNRKGEQYQDLSLTYFLSNARISQQCPLLLLINSSSVDYLSVSMYCQPRFSGNSRSLQLTADKDSVLVFVLGYSRSVLMAFALMFNRRLK